jgi:hypothetical protein
VSGPSITSSSQSTPGKDGHGLLDNSAGTKGSDEDAVMVELFKDAVKINGTAGNSNQDSA